MELEEMKQLWERQQAVAAGQQQVSEQLIRRLIDQQGRQRINRLLVFEYLALGICVLLLLVLLLRTDGLVFTTEISITYPLCLIFLLGGITWSLYKIRTFHQVDIAANPVTQSREQLNRIRLFFHQELKWSLIALPLMLPVFLSVVYMLVNGESVLLHISFYAGKLLIGLLLGWVILWYVYKKMYEPAFRRILSDIAEIHEFEA